MEIHKHKKEESLRVKKSWYLGLSVCKIKLYTFKTLISHNRKLTSQKAGEKIQMLINYQQLSRCTPISITNNSRGGGVAPDKLFI